MDRPKMIRVKCQMARPPFIFLSYINRVKFPVPVSSSSSIL
jgi:hypothetical protein